mmetsp:Transcript_89451/g.154952  ORF Transcript_89451/g.154952 Transcript_89451/m.154952 type:complete len:253 (-) Transcript_89451:454-1212(-)
MCSHLREHAPNVSASSSPFSCPQRRARKSMKYIATDRCWMPTSGLFQPSRYFSRMESIICPNLRAFSNFLWSDFPFTILEAASMTYLPWPFTFSVQFASQVTMLSVLTSFHLCPAGASGTFAPGPMLIVMSSGFTRLFSLPIKGCFPRPRKRPGGSMRKFPTGCFLPSQMQYLYNCSASSFSFLICNFCSFVKAFLISFCSKCHSQMRSKLTFSNERIGCCLEPKRFMLRSGFEFRIWSQSMKKFLRKMGLM